MASLSTVIAAMAVTSAGQRRPLSSETFFNPFKVATKATTSAAALKRNSRLMIKASLVKEKAVSRLTVAALTAVIVIPDIAEAAQPGVSPSLKNFLLSIAAGGVVLLILVGAVIAVANFDPVKRS